MKARRFLKTKRQYSARTARRSRLFERLNNKDNYYQLGCQLKTIQGLTFAFAQKNAVYCIGGQRQNEDFFDDDNGDNIPLESISLERQGIDY